MSEEEENKEEEEENEEVEENEEEGKEKEVEDKDEKIKELEEELAKEKEKEKNFGKLKDKEKGKQKKISERVGDLEAQVKQGQEDRQLLQDSIMKDAKGGALDQLAGDDKDLRAKLEERVKGSEAYLGVPKDSKDLVQRYESAYSYLEGNQKRVSPLHAYSPVTGTQNDPRKDKRFTDSKEGKVVMDQHFPQIVAAEKKDKK